MAHRLLSPCPASWPHVATHSDGGPPFWTHVAMCAMAISDPARPLSWQRPWLAFASVSAGLATKPHHFGLMPAGPLAKPQWAIQLLGFNAVEEDDDAEEEGFDDTTTEYITQHLRTSTRGKFFQATRRATGVPFGDHHESISALAAAVCSDASSITRSHTWPHISTMPRTLVCYAQPRVATRCDDHCGPVRAHAATRGHTHS